MSIIVLTSFALHLEAPLMIQIIVISGPSLITALVAIKKLLDGQERRRRDFIISDLEKWMPKTTFNRIVYATGNLKSTSHKDPARKDLPHLSRDIEVLKRHNAYVLWEEGKKNSETLKKEGMDAIENFHNMICNELEDIPLKKSLEIGSLSVSYYSVPRICEAIFTEINGEYHRLYAEPDGNLKLSVILDDRRVDVVRWALLHGEVRLARGREEAMKHLKKIIDDLVKDENVIKEVARYKEAEKKLNARETFKEFEDKLADIIEKLRFDP
jgi:hypothetical protein